MFKLWPRSALVGSAVLVLITAIAVSYKISPISKARQPAALFDEWAPNQRESEVNREFGVWRSPSRVFVLRCLKSHQDSDVFLLVASHEGTKAITNLGYGIGTIDVTWLQTSAGEIAVLDHRKGPGLNEILVLRPNNVRGKVSWVLAYKTPRFSETAGGLTVAHCYWTLLSSDGKLGSIRLKASWEFSDAVEAASRKPVTQGLYEIPIFYGMK